MARDARGADAVRTGNPEGNVPQPERKATMKMELLEAIPASRPEAWSRGEICAEIVGNRGRVSLRLWPDNATPLNFIAFELSTQEAELLSQGLRIGVSIATRAGT